jgi:hypothetical protein
MTETYTGENDTYPPNVAQIGGAFLTSLQAIGTADGPIFTLVHRSLASAGYLAEWTDADASSLVALKGVIDQFPVKGIFHGHDHYSHHTTWQGYRTFSPGSVTQAPTNQSQPYTTTYPESFLVVRVGDGWYDVASYVFGFDVNRVWAPGTWEWNERVHF